MILTSCVRRFSRVDPQMIRLRQKWLRRRYAGRCSPMQEGGLGVRSIAEVSLVFSLKLIWRLFSESHSHWVSWVKQYILRRESFWDVRDTVLGSWVWRKVLKLRTLVKQFVRMEVHNGQKCQVLDRHMVPSRQTN